MTDQSPTAAAERLMKTGVGGFADPEDLRIVCDAVLSAPRWQGIESAPKRKAVLCCWHDADHYEVHKAKRDDDFWFNPDSGEICNDPTHWMELPPQPKPRKSSP